MDRVTGRVVGCALVQRIILVVVLAFEGVRVERISFPVDVGTVLTGNLQIRVHRGSHILCDLCEHHRVALRSSQGLPLAQPVDMQCWFLTAVAHFRRFSYLNVSLLLDAFAIEAVLQDVVLVVGDREGPVVPPGTIGNAHGACA